MGSLVHDLRPGHIPLLIVMTTAFLVLLAPVAVSVVNGIRKHKGWSVFVLYVAMILFTNAYCQVKRYPVWFRKEATQNVDCKETRASTRVLSASVFWPFYWTTSGFMSLMDAPCEECDCVCDYCG